MFAGGLFMRPGQELRRFTVLRPAGRVAAGGRVSANGYVEAGSVEAALAEASPEEADRWRQLAHPVARKVVMRGAPPFDIRPGDVLELDGRRLHVQAAPRDPGGLGHWTVFRCVERADTA